MTTWLLALDTSTPCTALALGRVGPGVRELVAHATHDDRAAPASSLLAPRISALLAEAGIGQRALGAIACGVWPGTFTGTRVALATAKGLRTALERHGFRDVLPSYDSVWMAAGHFGLSAPQ